VIKLKKRANFVAPKRFSFNPEKTALKKKKLQKNKIN
jgi:hypothetical protein